MSHGGGDVSDGDLLSFAVSDRFRAAADEWAEQRLMESDEALDVKVEQALLEIEHLVSGATEVAFDLNDGVVRFEPSDDLAVLLDEQADATGLARDEILALHADLFARVFLDEASTRPPNAPPK